MAALPAGVDALASSSTCPGVAAPTVVKLARTVSTGEGAGDGSATVAVVFALACDPPVLVTLTEITSWPTLW